MTNEIFIASVCSFLHIKIFLSPKATVEFEIRRKNGI